MFYYIMSINVKVIACTAVSPLDPSDYDVNETNVRLKYLYNTLKGSIGDFRNSIIENNTQIPNMGKDDLISKHAFSFDIESDNIDEDF